MATTPSPIPERTYTFSSNTPAIADYVDHELDTVYGVLQGGLGDAHFATQANINGTKLAATTVPSTAMANNATIATVVGSLVSAGLVSMQQVEITLAPTANSSTSQTTSWPTPFTTFFFALSEIVNNSTNNATFSNGTQGSNTTTAHSTVYNNSGSTNTVTVVVVGFGII